MVFARSAFEAILAEPASGRKLSTVRVHDQIEFAGCYRYHCHPGAACSLRHFRRAKTAPAALSIVFNLKQIGLPHGSCTPMTTTATTLHAPIGLSLANSTPRVLSPIPTCWSATYGHVTRHPLQPWSTSTPADRAARKDYRNQRLGTISSPTTGRKWCQICQGELNVIKPSDTKCDFRREEKRSNENPPFARVITLVYVRGKPGQRRGPVSSTAAIHHLRCPEAARADLNFAPVDELGKHTVRYGGTVWPENLWAVRDEDRSRLTPSSRRRRWKKTGGGLPQDRPT